MAHVPPPSYGAPPIQQQPTGMAADNLLQQKLAAIDTYEIRQANVFLEAISLGAWANTYVISDANRKTKVVGREQDPEVSIPVLIVNEDSNCCVRCCCPGRQSLVARVYHAEPMPRAGKSCCGCYGGHDYVPDLNAGVAMTLERKGCCSKCLGCCICMECCVSDMFMMWGDRPDLKPGTTLPESKDWMGRSRQPMGGGGLCPQIDLSTPSHENFAVVEGPSLYGGWLSICCNTTYPVSSTKDKSGDIGKIVKPKVSTCNDCIAQFCTDVDHYTFETGPNYKQLPDDQKAVLLGNIMHLDYLLFENDLPPVSVKSSADGKSGVIICTLCQIYFYGCCIPIQICIPYGSEN